MADAVLLYAGSALGSLVMMCGLPGFVFPLFSSQTYAALGQGWGNSVLALASAVLGPPRALPLLHVRKAAARAKSERSHISQQAMKLLP